MIINRYYPDETVNIHIQSLINIIQENNWVITTKKGKGKLPLFRGNGERVNPIYDGHYIWIGWGYQILNNETTKIMASYHFNICWLFVSFYSTFFSVGLKITYPSLPF